jgi:tetratricopeptide (TPR) repeat protein
VRVFRLIAVLTLGGAGAAAAQLPAPQTQNLERLLILNVPAEPASDSAAAVAVIDAMRDRLIQLARYKVTVIPRAKICEALLQSGFPCTALLTDQQASQLSKALGVNSYNIGHVGRSGGRLGAAVRIISGGAGFSTSFSAEAGTAGTPQSLAEAIAQRLNSVVRAAEYARNCNEARARNALVRALSEANKAFAIEPNLAAANLCVATIREVQHAPPDSIIAAAHRALKGDPGNAEAWNRVAQASMVRGDTLGALDAYDSLLSYNAGDANLRKGLVSLLLQHKQYERAERLLSAGLKVTPGDQQMTDMRKRVCIEGGLYACTLEMLRAEVAADTTKLSDTTELKLALANAQAASDTQSMLWWARQAVKQFPASASFLKQLGGALQLAGQVDSSIAYYQKALAQNPGDVPTSLLIAKTIVERSVWDTTVARALSGDTTALRRARQAFVDEVDVARPYLAPGYASADSSIRLFTTSIAYGAGSKLAQAGAMDKAYAWLDPAYQQLASDTATGHQPLRSLTAFWYGLASFYTLPPLLQAYATSKKCADAPQLNDRLQKTRQALNLGARIAAQSVRQPLTQLGQWENFMQQMKKSLKCRNY